MQTENGHLVFLKQPPSARAGAFRAWKRFVRAKRDRDRPPPARTETRCRTGRKTELRGHRVTGDPNYKHFNFLEDLGCWEAFL